ncbi:hypothetical protein GA0115241_110032 [Streptomyces sp. DpondAA-D4]|nr:hypothetical protein GA0115241_110032 [Streptomyces sp. DpondAA-D4]
MRHHLFCCGGRGGPTGRSGYGRPGVRVASRRRWRVGQGECVGGGSVRASAAVTGPSGSGPSSRAPSPYAGPRPARSPASGRQAPPRPRGRGPADDVRDGSSNGPRRRRTVHGRPRAPCSVSDMCDPSPIAAPGGQTPRQLNDTEARGLRGRAPPDGTRRCRGEATPRAARSRAPYGPVAVLAAHGLPGRTVYASPRTRRRRKALGWDTASSSTFRQLPVSATDTRDMAVVPDGRAWRKCLGCAVSRARSNPPDPASFALSDHGSRITLK